MPHEATLKRRLEAVNVKTPQDGLDDGSRIILCPYCGRTQSGDHERCDTCGGWFEPLSVRATHIAMGPWFVRDKAQPFRPGCSFDVLRSQIEAGRIKPTTVIRGPTTRQMWSIARNTPGVAHLLGYCHACKQPAEPSEIFCPRCGQSFQKEHARNELGLLFPTEEAACEAKQLLDQEIIQRQHDAIMLAASARQPADRPGADLLPEVLGGGSTPAGNPEPESFVTATAGAAPASQPDQEPSGVAAARPFLAPDTRGEGGPQGRGSGDAAKAVSEKGSGSLGLLAWSLIFFNGIVLLLLIVLLVIWRS